MPGRVLRPIPEAVLLPEPAREKLSVGAVYEEAFEGGPTRPPLPVVRPPYAVAGAMVAMAGAAWGAVVTAGVAW